MLLCHTPKREYLRKLMHEPLPIESHLDHVMAEHMNAEVCMYATIPCRTAVDCMEAIFSFFFLRSSFS